MPKIFLMTLKAPSLQQRYEQKTNLRKFSKDFKNPVKYFPFESIKIHFW